MSEGQASCTSRCSRGYTRAILGVQRKLNSWTGSLGALSARRPLLVTSLSVLAAIACAVAFLRFRMESASDILWVPQGSKAMKDRDWVEAVYGAGGDGGQVLATVNPNMASQYGTNALQLGVFWELFQVDAAIRNITVTDGNTTYGWKDLCFLNFVGTCKYSGPLNLWSMNFTTYLQDVNGSSANATAGNRRALIDSVNQLQFPDGSYVSTLSIFGGIVLSPLSNPEPGQPPLYMSSAEVVAMGYTLRSELDDGLKKDWYKAFLDILKAWRQQSVYSEFAYIASNSVDDEISASVTNDLYLIVVSVLIFILVAVAGMSRMHLVATRSSLALLGVVSAVLAVLAGYGLSLLFGCPFTILSETLPYILLGMSIDCMFILTKAYDTLAAAAPHTSLEERFRRLLASTGTSVLVTLLASAVAFALGAISELPSVRWFSVYATMGVTCIIIATLTFFTGCFVLTERRIARNRLDCCCCVTSGNDPVPTAARLDSPSTCDPAVAAAPVKPAAGYPAYPPYPGAPANGGVYKAVVVQQMQQPSNANGTIPGRPVAESFEAQPGCARPGQPAPLSDSEAEPNLVKKLFARYYAPFLTRWYGKAFVLAIFAGWIVLTGVGIPRLGEGQPMSELAPDSSYLQYYVKVMENTYNEQLGTVTGLYFRYVDPSPPAQQAKMLRALGDALECEYVNSTISAFQGNWLIEFIGWVGAEHPEVPLVSLPGCSNPFIGRVTGDLGLFVSPTNITGCVPQSQFYPLLTEFLAANPGFMDDVRFNGPVISATASGAASSVLVNTSDVWTSRFTLVQTAAGDDGSYGRKSLGAIREVEDTINDELFAVEDEVAPEYVAFMYTSDYVYSSGDAILADMTIEYVLLAVAGVGIVLSATLPSPRAVLLMMLAVGLVDYFLFGEMFILGIRFNQVSIINMIMATGLAVDYAVYFAQRFVLIEADGSLDGRMVEALTDTGSAVFVGGITALAGTIPLAFASSTILRTFFKLLFGTICFALLTGLMLMPVVFSLVGPSPLQKDELAAARAAAEGATTEPAAGGMQMVTVVEGSGRGRKDAEAV